MKKPSIKNNKNFWKWITYSVLLIIFATSAIMNISYLPKYFALKNQTQSEQVLDIDIVAYDEDEKTELISFHYQTILTTLGRVMKQHSNTYILTSFPSGSFLSGIRYIDENGDTQEKLGDTKSWWEIYHNGKSAQVGMDDLFLKTNDTISLYFRT